MCHVSPVTYHLSPVTCHLSPVTCHLSPVTCHLTHVTCHQLRMEIGHNSWICNMYSNPFYCSRDKYYKYTLQNACHTSHVITIIIIFIVNNGQSGEAIWWRVCYQRGLSHIVSRPGRSQGLLYKHQPTTGYSSVTVQYDDVKGGAPARKAWSLLRHLWVQGSDVIRLARQRYGFAGLKLLHRDREKKLRALLVGKGVNILFLQIHPFQGFHITF